MDFTSTIQHLQIKLLKKSILNFMLLPHRRAALQCGLSVSSVQSASVVRAQELGGEPLFISHYYEILSNFYEILSHYYEKLSHYYEKLSHYYEIIIMTHYNDLQDLSFFHHSGGNGLFGSLC